MDKEGFVADVRGDTRRAQLARIVETVVMQGVERRRHQEGGRQSAVVPFLQGLCILVAAAPVDLAIVKDIRSRQARGLGLRDIGSAGDVSAQPGIDENLACQRRSAVVARPERQRGGKISPALSPATTTRSCIRPSAESTDQPSSKAAGKGCSGARR